MLASDTTAAPAAVLRSRYQDPYQYFAWLRQHAPVVQEPRPNGLSVWHVSKYSDVSALLANERLRKGFDEVPPLEAAVAAYETGALGLHRCLLHANSPGRTRVTRLMNHVSAARYVAEVDHLVRMEAGKLIKVLPPGGTVDLMANYAFPLICASICVVLGIPEHMRTHRFRQVVAATLLSGPRRGSRPTGELRAHLAAIVQRKRSQDEQGDVLGALVLARDNRDRFSNEELISVAYMLMTLVHDTLINLVGNGVLALLRHPGQLSRLRYAPELLPTAIDELLRYDSPFRIATFRLTAEFIKIRGTVIPRGHIVNLVMGSANRDGSHFARPDELNLTRSPNDHLSLGLGAHDCLCAALVRRCAAIAIGSLVERLDMRLGVADEALRWWPSDVVRGLVMLPVSYRKR